MVSTETITTETMLTRIVLTGENRLGGLTTSTPLQNPQDYTYTFFTFQNEDGEAVTSG